MSIEPVRTPGGVPARVAVPRAGIGLRYLLPGIAGFAALMAVVRRKRSEAFDLAISLRVQAIRHPVLERAMAFVSWFGFPPQSRLIPPSAMLGLWLARYRLESGMLLAAWGSALASTVIKQFMRRPRPVAGTDLRVVAADLGGSSFPSGHVLTYVGVYGWLSVVAEVAIRPRRLRRLVVAALATLIAGVGPSRIHLGHHWPTDVAASYLLGSSYLAALVLLYRRLKGRQVPG
jgi:membrane-associated phospholipid phosphatase